MKCAICGARYADDSTPQCAHPQRPVAYRGAGAYLFALDQVRNALALLDRLPDGKVGTLAMIGAYLTDAERALDDAITEVPPLPGHGVRRG